MNGADPSLGGTGASLEGNPDGSSIELSKNRTYVAKDNEAYVHLLGPTVSQIFNRIFSARLYCAMSSITSFCGTTQQNRCLRILNVFLNIIVVTLSVLLVPTVNFRFKPEDVTSPKFKNDEEGGPRADISEEGLAYYTCEKMGPENIGLRGVINNGLSGDIGKRMSVKPAKTVWGLVKLINPIGIMILAVVGVMIAKNKICGESVNK